MAWISIQIRINKWGSDPNAIPGARPTAPLNVAKGRNTSVKAKTISEHVFNIVCTDRFEIGIMCALCYNHYGLALSDLAVLNCTGISCMTKDHHTQSRTR
jgi:hypothetical protein